MYSRVGPDRNFRNGFQFSKNVVGNQKRGPAFCRSPLARQLTREDKQKRLRAILAIDRATEHRHDILVPMARDKPDRENRPGFLIRA